MSPISLPGTYGINLIAVSSHMGARPLCSPYQGQVFSRDGSRGTTKDGNGNIVTYYPLSETSFGQPAGLFGINCGHVQYPFIPTINVQRYFPYDEDANAERYKQFQKQRAMERAIKADKRECMMLQQTDDAEGLQKVSQRLRRDKEKYINYCNETGLGQHLDRTQVYGYDRSKSMKTVWAERKALDKTSESGIINTGAISGALNPYSKEAEKHAIQYYESVRHMKTDTQKISSVTGISRDKIEKIKNHVFLTEHDLLTGHKHFDPSYEMAQSWQRLINGDFKEQDIVLLKHEYLELRYMEKGYSQNEAHILASKKYNYAKYCE